MRRPVRKLTVFEFHHFSVYLEALCQENRWSAKRLAQKLGYRSDRTVGMVISQKRSPSRKFIEKLSTLLSLDISEQRYLALLGMQARSRGDAFGGIEQLTFAQRALQRSSEQVSEFLELRVPLEVHQIEAAKHFLRQMMIEFEAKFATTQRGDRFQLNIQFFCPFPGSVKQD